MHENPVPKPKDSTNLRENRVAKIGKNGLKTDFVRPHKQTVRPHYPLKEVYEVYKQSV